MKREFITSDLHLGAKQDFVWKARGFSSPDIHNKEIVSRWNSVVCKNDTVYLLGDVFIGDIPSGIKLVEQLNGNIILLTGNHDTGKRLDALRACKNITEIYVNEYVTIQHGRKTYFLSHFPMITNSNKKWSIAGHTHGTKTFEHDHVYNVALDAHDCCPIELQTVFREIEGRRN